MLRKTITILIEERKQNITQNYFSNAAILCPVSERNSSFFSAKTYIISFMVVSQYNLLRLELV